MTVLATGPKRQGGKCPLLPPDPLSGGENPAFRPIFTRLSDTIGGNSRGHLPRAPTGIERRALSKCSLTIHRDQPVAQQTGRSDVLKAEFAIGQRYSVRRERQEREARKLAPGLAATTDDRLNLHVDDQEIVRRVTCG
jgi:hypothetical protein